MPKIYLSAVALAQNYRQLTAQAEGEIIPVLKADAYGHGALFALSHLLDEGASSFAVACAAEAIELLNFIEKSKYSFTKTRILVMGEVEEDDLPLLLSPRTMLAVHSPAYAKKLSVAIGRLKTRLLLPEYFTVRVHLKLETGMQRLGLRTEESIKVVLSLPHIAVTGAYSHLAHAADRKRTEAQAAHFLSLLTACPTPIETHLAASEGLLRYGGLSHAAARTGLALYGVAPKDISLPLTPVMRFTVRVLSVFRAVRGSFVGYGSVCTERDRRLAVFDAGYADGIPPRAGEGGSILVKGRVCPLFGEVCMDRFTADVGDLPLREGEEVTLFGEKAGDTRRAAEMLGVSPYALLTVRSARTRRIVLKEV